MAISIFNHDKARELGLEVNSHSSFPAECFTVTYVGAVLDTYEHNGRDDSDFYAVVWDETEQRVKEVQYATTRGWTYNNGATVDATPEVWEKAQNWQRAINIAREESDIRAKYARAYVGATVTVVRGRKVPKGFTGKVLSLSERYNPYERYNYNQRKVTWAFVASDTASYEVQADYLEVTPNPDYVEACVQAHMADFKQRIARSEVNGRSMLYAGLRSADFAGLR